MMSAPSLLARSRETEVKSSGSKVIGNKMHLRNSTGADYTFIGFKPCLEQFISTPPNLIRVCALK